MAKDLQHLEEIFRKSFEGHREEPSGEVLKKLRQRLWLDDFFSVRPGKFNIVYTGLIAAGLATLMLYSPSNRENSVSLQPNALDDVRVSRSEIPATSSSEDVPKGDEEITRKEAPLPPMAEFSVETTEGCAPFRVDFKNNSKAANEVHWDFGNGHASGESNPSVLYAEPGTYDVVLTVRNKAGDTDKRSETIVVHPRPEAGIGIDIPASDIGRREIHFRNQSTQAKKYIWDFGDQETGTSSDVVHVYDDYKVYRVSLIAMNDHGCADTAYFTNRFIEKDFELSFPSVFRPIPSGGSNRGYYQQAGMEAGIFHPDHNGAQDYHLEIFTQSGLEVFDTENILQGWNGFIRGRMAPPGMYKYRTEGTYPNGKKFLLEGTFRLVVEDYYMN